MPTDASSGAVVEADVSQLVPPSDRKHVVGGGGPGRLVSITEDRWCFGMALVLIVSANRIFVKSTFHA